MKQAIYYLLVLLMGVSDVMAQSPCPLNNITTNPANPSPSNPPPGKEFKRNTFDWRSEFINADNSSYYTSNSPLTNFFNYEVNNPNFQHIAKGTASDYYPEEGWELIKRDFGRLANGSLNPVRSEGPYLILYNKYSGILRVLAAFPGLGAQQAVNIKISFKPKDVNNANQNQLGLSGLFNTYGKTAQAMDIPTIIDNVVTPSVFPGSDRRFFYADFQTSYDPCTCLFESALVVEFSTINVFTAQLSGREIGISEPLAVYLNGSYKLDKNQDFLSSLFQNDAATNNVQAGILMYTTIQKMVDDYKFNALRTPNSPSGLASALDGFNTFLTFGKSLIGLVGGEWPAVLTAIGGMSSFFSSKVKAPGSPAATSSPSIIHSEMALTGTITDQRILASSYLNFATPGSKKSNDKPEYNDGVNVSPPDVDYPVYNETLGTFTLLETPKIQWGNTDAGYDPACGEDGGTNPYVFQLGRDLKYAYNPKANIDDNLSKIYAAWVIDIGPSGVPACDAFDGINMKMIKYRQDGLNIYATYISPFLELNDFKNLSAGVTLGSFLTIQHIYLRLRLEMVSNDLDRAGNRNQVLSIVTYELPLNTYTNDIPSVHCPIYPVEHTFDNNGPFYTNNELNKYWGTVTINVPISSPTPIVLSAQNFVLGPNGSVGSGITLNTTNFVTPGVHIKAQSTAAVTDFCTSTSANFRYKANLATRVRPASAIAPLPTTKKADSAKEEIVFDVSPNPAQSVVRINYSLLSAQKVDLYITDVAGRLIDKIIISSLQSPGDHTVTYNSSKLLPGIYYYTIVSDNFKQTKKLVILK